MMQHSIQFDAKLNFMVLLLAGCCLIVTAGCGDSGGGLASVEGTVTLDGQPLAGAEVIFRPTGGRPSMGKTDSNGIYKLRYSAEKMGAVVGTHSVTISTGGDEADDEDEDSAPAKERVPAEYNSRTTLTAEVKPGQKEPIDFDLTTNAKPF